MPRYRLPLTRAGQVIGLLGGSFDPPHAGHLHISREALKRFGLDQLWWLVSPGNPLKEHGPAPMARRMAAARALVEDDPRIRISDFEAQAGTRYTAESLAVLQAARPGVRFVWLMGADNLFQLHHWQDWQDIMMRVPVGILARPGKRTLARTSKAAKTYEHVRLPGRKSQLLARSTPPVWCFVNVPMRDISSTRLRQSGAWPVLPPEPADS